MLFASISVTASATELVESMLRWTITAAPNDTTRSATSCCSMKAGISSKGLAYNSAYTHTTTQQPTHTEETEGQTSCTVGREP